jgi:hypothetical protein
MMSGYIIPAYCGAKSKFLTTNNPKEIFMFSKKVLSLSLTLGLLSVAAAGTQPLIIPTPKHFAAGSWNVKLSSPRQPSARIVVEKSSPLLDSAVKQINRYVLKYGGKALPVVKHKKSTGINIILASGWKNINLKKLKIPTGKRNKQAYLIRFCGRDIILSGKGDRGTLYAAVSFSLLLKNSNGSVVAYSGDIEDYPDFNYRGDGDLGRSLLTRGYLFNAQRMQLKVSYPQLIREYIDFCLDLKLNVINLTDSHKYLVFRGNDYTQKFMGSTQILASNIRSAKSAYRPKRQDDFYILKAGSQRWELDLPLGAQYSWNTNAPGSEELDYTNKYDFNSRYQVNRQFRDITVPDVTRFVWGAKAAKAILPAYNSALDIYRVTAPEKILKGINRKYHRLSRRLLDKNDSAFFKLQEQAAATASQAALKILQKNIPVNYSFLRLRATRLYKDATMVKLLAPIYYHYYAAKEAVDQGDKSTAQREITAATTAVKQAEVTL